MLTGIKDVDINILNKLEDKDLVNICQTNKKADEICKDEGFWLQRIFTKFPYLTIDILKEYKGVRSWSDYYIYDLRRFSLKKYPNVKLTNALKNGRLDQVIILLNRGAWFNNMVSIASANGQLNIVKYLIEKVKNTRDQINGAFMHAVQLGYLDIIKYLIEKGADINALWGFALRRASENGHLAVVKYLVENGADIHVEADSPVKNAYYNGHLDIVEYLVKHGAIDPR